MRCFYGGWWVLQIKKMEADIKNLKDNPQTTLLEVNSGAAHSSRGQLATREGGGVLSGARMPAQCVAGSGGS